ncbi:HEPN domain-containing protein [Bradyrhizobium sp. RDM4]|uniref:HEPN domain-containing protein n=1 Tax=Bradyrhizobium sp. RDM4 TaxID=3378765 RepID=UPI0038FC9CB7
MIEQRFKDLEKLVVAAEEKGIDPQVQSYFCKLGIVLVCGNIERCVEHIVTERVGRSPQVTSFLKGYFKRGTNYDCEEIKNLFYRFDKKWGGAFEDFVTNNIFVKDSISSCYGLRNALAHGGTANIGHRALRQYFNASFDLVAQAEFCLR